MPDKEDEEEEEKKDKPPEAKPISLGPSKAVETTKTSEEPPPPPPGYGPPPPGYGPPAQPFFTADNLQKRLALGLFLGIIILLVGAILSAGGGFIDADDHDDADLQRNLWAGATLVGGIGLFVIAIFLIVPLMVVNNLSEKQKKILIMLLLAVIIGYALLI